MLMELSKIAIERPVVKQEQLQDFKLPSNLVTELNTVLGQDDFHVNAYSSFSITDHGKAKKGNNYAIIPNQYFLYASMMYVYAIELIKYFDIFDAVRSNGDLLVGDGSEIAKAIINDDKLASFFSSENDIHLFSKFMSKSDSTFREGAKRLIDDQGKARGSKDCFGSVILKVINLPDASSGIFGGLVYALVKSPLVYKKLYEYYQKTKLIHKTDVILENDTIRDFSLSVFKYLYQNEASQLSSDLEKNTLDVSRLDLLGLKKIIKVSNVRLNQDELVSGAAGTLRFFEEPIINEGTFWYFSTQWYGDYRSGLSFGTLREYVANNYVNYKLQKEDDKFQLLLVGRKTVIIYDEAISKPFLLLAGISGTGKTRFVREQAEASGNLTETYNLVSVRPDWHEPSDLLGYVSRLSGKAEYVVTDVLKFLVQAWKEIVKTDIELNGSHVTGSLQAQQQVRPFWLCLDEMNLAPVEQYFADYLSVLETREWQWKDDEFIYRCAPLLKASVLMLVDAIELRKKLDLTGTENDELWNYFCLQGISLPFNLLVAGTVNMDETAHGFSRKVIDRALTFDFGEFFPNKFDEFFEPKTQPKTLTYPVWSSGRNKVELSHTVDTDGMSSINFLNSINTVLDNTPFKLAYRALNELLLSVMTNKPSSEEALQAVWDDFLMCKILPRIEGDIDKLTKESSGTTILEQLEELLATQLSVIWEGEVRPDLYRKPMNAEDELILINCRSKAKLCWMRQQLQVGFTSFWP